MAIVSDSDELAFARDFSTPMDTFLVGYDFYYLYAATSIWMKGGNPYDVAAFAAELHRIGWPATEGVQGLTHPPTTELFALPFSLFSFPVAKICWLLFLAFILAIGSYVSFKNETLRRLHGLADPFPYSLAVLCFPPIISNVIWGQHNAIPFLGLIGGLAFYTSSFPVLAGIAFSLTTLKPHLFIPFFVLVFGFEIVRRRVGLLAGFVAGLTAQCLMTFAINPNSFTNYRASFSTIGGDATAIWGASPVQILSVYFASPGFSIAAMGVTCIVMGFLAFKETLAIDRLVLLILPLSLAVSPYVWNHSFVLLLIPYLRLVRHGFDYFGPRFRFAIAALGGIGVFIGLIPDLNPYTAVFPLLLVGAYLLLPEDANRNVIAS